MANVVDKAMKWLDQVDIQVLFSKFKIQELAQIFRPP